MSAVDKYHDEAMEAAFFADQERRRGNQKRSEELFDQALDLELKALGEMLEPVEPTYSILHRSAGWLALDCNKPRLAEQLASKALAGEPDSQIAEELRDLLEQINFRRHLELRGISLGEGEIQLSLSGQHVGLGMVSQGEVFGRVENSSKIIQRIVERRSKEPFRERGRPKKDIAQNYELFVSTPRAASFAVTLKLGRPTGQLFLPGVLTTNDVLDEFMDLMEMVSQSRISEIRNRISDPAYFRNFIGLSRKIAPDGERIRQVGLTSLRNGTERFVDVSTPASEFPPLPVHEELKEFETEPVELRGVLRYADATSDARNRIKIIGESREAHIIEVPDGMMNDIVRPLWASQVRVNGIRKGSRIILEDIWPDD